MPLSKIVAKSITDDTITTDQIADTSVHGRRNLVINGSMQVAQRGTSHTVSAVGTYTLDRFVVDESTSGTLTVSQDTESPNDFKYSMKITPATADTSIAAAEYARVKVHLEGYDTNRFAFGTSSAKPITFSFYAKTNKTGTYCVALDLLGGTERTYMEEFSLTNSWARYELNIPANTAQAFGSTTNGKAAELQIVLAAGSSYHGTAGDFTNTSFATSNQINFMDSTSNELYITGLQMEVGEQATPFEHRSYGEELALCERYFQKYECSAQQLIYFEGNTADHKWTHTNIYRKMRATPSVSLSSNFGHGGGAGGTINSVSATSIGPDRVSYRVGFTSAHGSSYQLRHSDSFDGDVASYSAEI